MAPEKHPTVSRSISKVKNQKVPTRIFRNRYDFSWKTIRMPIEDRADIRVLWAIFKNAKKQFDITQRHFFPVHKYERVARERTTAIDRKQKVPIRGGQRNVHL